MGLEMKRSLGVTNICLIMMCGQQLFDEKRRDSTSYLDENGNPVIDKVME